ncbi:MAG: glycosyl hydrolase family 28 protein [Blautia sp.]|nr:glycosyl hydrolase family 28 protein [Lachnoclostridium sp.]MCM1210751.1 glycosyl hydrolase family 28 protein [Blautia sp.]
MKTYLYDGPKSLQNAIMEDLMPAAENKRDIRLKCCTDIRMSVNGQECYVYETNVNHSRKWEDNFFPLLARTPVAYFDFEEKTDIKITFMGKFPHKMSIHPSGYNLIPVADKEQKTISFSIQKPDTYTIMLDDLPERAIHIFANAPEMTHPSPEDENILYYGAGEWNAGVIRVQSGQTVYLAGGAVVHGTIYAEHVENVTVMGRGILDGSLYEGWKAQSDAARVPLQFDNCKNVAIKDILVLNSNAWVCQGFNTQDMQIEGLKIISCRPNGDGITLQSCKRVTVKHCFVRSWDDSLVVKNYLGNSEQIYFSDIQLWTDFAQSMEIGYETNKGGMENSVIRDVRFNNICVLHNFHKPILSIHNADEALVENVVFQNIVVEDARMGSGDGAVMPYLIDFVISGDLGWSTTKRRGNIRDIRVENVKVLDGRFCGSRIAGFDDEHKVSQVLISNLEILGKTVTDAETGKFEIDKKTTEQIYFQ